MKHILFFSVILHMFGFVQAADLIIFSYHRPLQLYAFLESIENFVSGLQDIYVVYRSDQEQFSLAYQEVFKKFSFVIPLKESRFIPEHTFYDLTHDAIKKSQSDYLLFAVDDLIVKDNIDVIEGRTSLEQSQAYALFYRLGLHLSLCYPLMNDKHPQSGKQPLPPLKKINEKIYNWEFATGIGDWNYPHSVDMTLYRKKDIQDMFKKIGKFNSPNQLESQLAALKPRQSYGICYENSKVINIPLNRVQNEYDNRSMNSYSVQELLEFFEKGFKIDIRPLYKIKNQSAHIDYEFTFIKRDFV